MDGRRRRAAASRAAEMDFLGALNLVLLFMLMTGLGCAIDYSALRTVLRKPRGVAVGLLSQFVVLPALAAGVATVAGLADVFAVGLVVMCCCPGGAISNVLCLFFQVDIALSVACTAASSSRSTAAWHRALGALRACKS